MKLLLIHTGGTIGMVPTPDGLAPQAGMVEAALEAMLPSGITLIRHVFDPLLDSADVGPSHWNILLNVIRSHPDVPVIVTHGSDTMSFTGAALSQALAGEARRVVLCGSMKPLGQNADAEGNLALAIGTALAPGAGVFLAFAGKLLPAAGLVKHDSQAEDAFCSQPQSALEPAQSRLFSDKRLGILSLSPGMDGAFLGAALGALDGAVLRVFGSGTAMSDPAVLSALAKAVSGGKRVRAVSQCEAGGLEPGAYAAGAGLWAAGVENGGAETPEAALIHLWLN